MTPPIWLLLSLATVAALAPGAEAGPLPPTVWDVGACFEFGAFGVRGDFAEREHAEGGTFLRAPLHVRVFDWEVDAHFYFAGGVADNKDFAQWGAKGYGLSLKRYLPLAGGQRRRAYIRLEAYLRGGIDTIEIDRFENDNALAFSYGGGIKVRFQAGRRNRAKLSYGLYADLGRIHAASGPQADSHMQTITFGATLIPGVGK